MALSPAPKLVITVPTIRRMAGGRCTSFKYVRFISKRKNGRVKLYIRDIFFVGDSENDIDVFMATGKGISVHCSDDYLKKVAWKNLETLDQLGEIL